MATEPTEAGVLDALRAIIDPDLKRDIVTLGFVKELVVEPTAVRFNLELTTPACPVRDLFVTQCQEAIQKAFPQVTTVDVALTAQVRKDPRINRDQYLPGVANAILVASGKGGVGKSTVAVNLAMALHKQGARVGLLDADIYGPSIPTMFGLETARLEVIPPDRMKPAERFGLRLVSAGFMTPPGQPLVLRGPMLHGILTQFLANVEWGELDYLIIDLPPGTGDVQLTITQALKATGAVIVTTPQDVALADVDRAVAMFRIPKLNVPVLGVVENMSLFCCPNCGHETEIFRAGGGEKAAAKYGVPFLGKIPLEPAIPPAGDEGVPIVEREPDSPIAKHFADIAGALVRNLHHVEVDGEAPAEATQP